MNAILSEIYSTIIPSAPYIIAAYAFVLAALLVYVLIVAKNLKRAHLRMDLLEEELAHYEAKRQESSAKVIQ